MLAREEEKEDYDWEQYVVFLLTLLPMGGYLAHILKCFERGSN